jgi:hypothetical protein
MNINKFLIFFLTASQFSCTFSQSKPYIISEDQVWVAGYEFRFDEGDTIFFPARHLFF